MNVTNVVCSINVAQQACVGFFDLLDTAARVNDFVKEAIKAQNKFLDAVELESTIEAAGESTVESQTEFEASIGVAIKATNEAQAEFEAAANVAIEATNKFETAINVSSVTYGESIGAIRAAVEALLDGPGMLA